MTEKQFTYEEVNFCNDNLTGEQYDLTNPNEMLELLNNLVDENEQLKQTIKSVYELLTIEIDVFSDKAIEHDLIAYRELQQLDNKDAYYIATATKKAIKMLKELQE